MTTYRGEITGLSGHPMSGLWQLFTTAGMVHIGSGHGVRQLAHAFGATEGAGDLMEKIVGQEIVYTVDFMGVLEGFTPIDEWDGPEIPEEGIEEDELERLLRGRRFVEDEGGVR